MADNAMVRCPHCNEVIHVPRESLGQVVSCPQCFNEMRVPADPEKRRWRRRNRKR